MCINLYISTVLHVHLCKYKKKQSIDERRKKRKEKYPTEETNSHSRLHWMVIQNFTLQLN